jgi:hypothetical protein
MLGDVGRAQGAGQAFAGDPTLAAASQIPLHSPDTMASIAARTFLVMRFGGPISAVGAGWSSASSERLAGIGGVMFSVIGLSATAARSATHQNVTFLHRAGWPLHDSERPAYESGLRGLSHARVIPATAWLASPLGTKPFCRINETILKQARAIEPTNSVSKGA